MEELKKIKEYYAKNPKDPENSEIDYYIQIIKSNANLLSFSKNKIDMSKEEIDTLKKNKIPNLSKISKIYHEFNLEVLEKKLC